MLRVARSEERQRRKSCARVKREDAQAASSESGCCRCRSVAKAVLAVCQCHLFLLAGQDRCAGLSNCKSQIRGCGLAWLWQSVGKLRVFERHSRQSNEHSFHAYDPRKQSLSMVHRSRGLNYTCRYYCTAESSVEGALDVQISPEGSKRNDDLSPCSSCDPVPSL